MKLSSSQRRWFLGATFCVFLATLAAMLFDLLLAHWRPSIDLSAHSAITLSERTKSTLTDTAGTIDVTCIFPEESPLALPTGHLLRSYQEVSKSVAGATLEITYVDPRVETATATRLMAQGARGTGIFLRQAGRTVFVPEQALLSPSGGYAPAEAELALTAAIARLSRQDGIVVGWLIGHGEPKFDDTNPSSGYSGLRRALENEGCVIRELMLDVTASEQSKIPSDINVILIVNPRYPVSAVERGMLSDWLDRGGRLLCALPPAGEAGLGPLLERWGIRVGTLPRQPVRRTAGNAGLTTLLSKDHLVTRELNQAMLTFRAPRALTLIPIKGVTLTPLVEMSVYPLANAAANAPIEELPIMVAAERGSRVGEDLAFRPGRLIVVGEAGFAENDYLLNHASANRDISVNALRWLTGLTGSGAQSGSSGVIRFEQDRRTWWLQRWIIAGAVPLFFSLLLWFLTRRRL